MPATPIAFATLRQRLAGLGAVPPAGGSFSLGPAAADGLPGGLARGALHEVLSTGAADAPAAAAFALGLALRAAGGRTIVWARQETLEAEAGRPYGPGLAELGLDPAALVLVRLRDAAATLRAGLEAARCAALGAALIELRGEPKALDLTATRRLSLAALRSGVAVFLLRVAASERPSAAVTRWAVEAAASVPLQASAPGPPAFAVALTRHRGGVPGRAWRLEWSRDRKLFEAASDEPPLSRSVVPVPFRRPAAPPTGADRQLRQAG